MDANKNKKTKLKSKSEKWDNWYAAGDAILIFVLLQFNKLAATTSWLNEEEMRRAYVNGEKFFWIICRSDHSHKKFKLNLSSSIKFSATVFLPKVI